MIFTDISNIRLINQQITATKFKSVKEVVGWMGAMQAQDYSMAKWAIGLRLPGSIEEEVETAINKGEIIRTHLLRPTWHIVSADEVYWMLELTAPQIKARLRSRHKGLELTEPVIMKGKKIIEKVLTREKYVTADELISEFEKSNIATGDNRGYHILLLAELDKIICSGPTKYKKQTYGLLQDRVPKIKTLTREEALIKLAKQYFSSRSPATLQDFVWWSGLGINDARNALEMIKPDLVQEKIGVETYWLSNLFNGKKIERSSVYLLPAFDEFIISYKDRSAMISKINFKKAVSNNGVFRPVIMIDGWAVGLWKKIIKKDRVIMSMDFFHQPLKVNQNLFGKAVKTYERFLGKTAEIIYNNN